MTKFSLHCPREFNGLANLDDEAVQLVVREDRIFVTGAARNGTNSEIVTMGYTADGEIFSVKTYDSPFGLNDKPTAMGIDLDNNLIIVGQIQENDTTFRNMTVKYNVMEKPIVPVYVDSVPAYNARELIVRFDKTAMNLNAVDKKNFDAGLLKDFVHDHVIDSLNTKFPFDAGRLQTFKIFHRMTTADSLSITRLGDTIPVPAFWATLSVMMPDEFDLFEAIDSLNTMKPMVHYGEVNAFGFLANGDPVYATSQSGLFDPSYGINVEYAWMLTTGKSYVKVGVYDSGVHWKHIDFSLDENNVPATLNDSKVVNGFNYENMVPLEQDNYSPYLPYTDDHGTAVAGIIGAIRNNDFCISGIAGGDFQELNSEGSVNFGASLYSFRTTIGGVNDTNQLQSVEKATLAIFDGAFSPLPTDTTRGFALHIQNHSWTTKFPSQAMEEQVLFAYKNNCAFVAASGNSPMLNTCLSNTCVVYPASYDNEWVMKVGANDMDGLVPTFSVRGNDLDFVAPGVVGTFRSLGISGYVDCDYVDFGTSFSAPHVSGTAALMLSKHNLLNEEADYPNNLAPDDVETILKLTARDIDAPGYPAGPDVKSGYGIIDAGQAVLQVSLPYYYVQHNGTLNNHDFELDAADINISIANSMCGSNLSPGNYVADRYVVHQNYTNLLPIEYTVVNHWGRPSSTDGLNNNSSVSCRPWVDYSYNETVFSTERLIEIETTTYCWHITEDANGNPMDFWIPMHPSEARTAYSLHIQTDEIVPVDLSLQNESVQPNVMLYPNPTNGNELFLNGLPDNHSAEISFVNLAGQTILRTSTSATDNRSIDISALDAGFYIVQIKVNNELIIRNFIKL